MSVSGSRKDLMRFLLLQVKQNALDVDTAKAFIRTIEEGGSSTEPIAVVGVAGRLPGADDKDTFWANLVAGRESIGDFPEERLDDLRRVADPGRQTKGGYLDRVDEFDPEYFGITPQAAVELDPYHRMVMELLVETMEDAGHPRSSLEGSRTGVFVGTDNSHRLNMSYLPFLPEVDFSAMSGSWPGLLAGRLSYHFDLRGPAMVTDTGCSSGLLALDSAIKAIRAGDCSGALVAAVNLFLNPGSLGSETESADCQVRAFDADAHGTVWSEGLAAVYIKPLSQAVADRDHVYGLITGHAVNSDGRSNGITAPNAKAQKDLLLEAWKRARIDPETIGYIEAHGTGTVLGDPIEISGLKSAFGQFTQRRQFCGLGSVKTNVGHTVGAAGLVSLVKTLLCLDREAIPASLNFEVPNSYLDLVDSPVYMVDQLTSWRRGEAPRRAGVSCFSLAGTNAHVVLEEAPVLPPREVDEGPFCCPLSGRTPDLLRETAGRLARALEDSPGLRLDDVCFTMQVGREHLDERAVIFCEDRAGLLAGLRALEAADGAEADLNTAFVVRNGDPLEGDALTRFGALLAPVRAFLDGAPRPFSSEGSARRVSLPVQRFDHARYWDETVHRRQTTSQPVDAADDWVAEAVAGPSRLEGGTPGSVPSIVAHVWCDVLGYPQLRAEDDFFGLGGDSVSSVKIVQALSDGLGLEIPAPLLLAHPTVDEFAVALIGLGVDEDRIRRAADGALAAAPRHDHACEPEEYELALTAPQRSMYLSARLDEDSVAYNVSGLTISRAGVDVAALEDGVRAMTRRHDSLRATFHMSNGVPVQRIHAEMPVTIERHQLAAPAAGETHEELARRKMSGFVRPFNLEEGPLFRIGHLEFADGVTCIATDFHHIITDGTSMGILFGDLETVMGGTRPAPLARGYRAALGTLVERESGEAMRAHRRYWSKRFADDVPVLQLVTDWHRPDVVSGAGATLFTEIDAETSQRLRQFARDNDLTPFMVLLATFGQLLSRMSGQHDVVIGSPVMGRPGTDYADLVGMFVNTLPIRLRTDPATPVAGFLEEVRATVLEAFAHQDCPLELFLQDVEVRREPGRRPLFDVCFVHQNTDMGLETGGDEVLSFDDGSAKYDITLSTRESGGRLLLEWEYSTDLFREETIRLYADRYVQLLTSLIASAPQEPVSELRLLPAAEVDLIRRLATTPSPATESIGIAGLFAARVAEDPEQTALIHGAERVSYGAFDARVTEIARGILRLGVTPGQPVALLFHRSTDMVAAIMGVLRAGCYYVPLNPEFPEERLRHVLADSGAKFLLTSDECLQHAGTLGLDMDVVHTVAQCAEVGAADGPEEQFAGIPGSSADPAYVMYTSGTTGLPKGSVIRQRSVMRVVRHSSFYEAGPQDVFLLMSDYSFDGSVYDMFGALLNGSTLVIVDKADVLELDRLGAAIRDNGVTSFFITAAMFNALIDSCPQVLGSVRCLLFGGEAASPVHVKRAFDILGPGRIANGYGPTETTVFAAVHVVHDVVERDAIPIGRPINDTSLWVLDADRRLAPIGASGELFIGGGGLADGYLHLPELTAERFVTSPDVPGERLYRTGDLVTVKSNGLVYYSGRLDQQVKFRGYRIETAEIVQVALDEPEVLWAHAAVHEQDGVKNLCLWVRFGEGGSDDTRLRSALRRKLPSYMIPSFIVPTDEVPLTRNGKLDAAALPSPTQVSIDAGTGSALEGAEAVVAQVWTKVLGVPVDSADADFFTLGGDSIKAIQIVAGLKGHGLQVTVADMLECQTVGDLSARAAATSVTTRTYDQAPMCGPVVAGPIQAAYLAAGDIDGVYTQSLVVTMPGTVTAGELGDALEKVMAHHDMLRVRVCDDDGEPGLTVLAPEEGSGLGVLWAPAGGSEEEITAFLGEVQAGTDARRGPIVAVGIDMPAPEGMTRFVVAAHHVAVDVVSWGIILEDLATAVRGEDLLPTSVPFPQWTRELRDHVHAGGLHDQLPYWKQIQDRARAVLPLFAEEEIRREETTTRLMRLPEDVVDEVFEHVRGTHGLDQGRAALAVVCHGIARWSGRDEIVCTLEGHGRETFAEEHDLTRTVGWFTSAFPHVVESGRDARSTLDAVRGSFDRLPGNGFGYGPLRWYSGELSADGAQVSPQISFNYLGEQGRPAGDLEVTHLSGDLVVDPAHRSRHVLDFVVSRDEGELLVEVRHPRAWSGTRVDGLVQAIQSAFEEFHDLATAADRRGFRTSASVAEDALDDILLGLADG